MKKNNFKPSGFNPTWIYAIIGLLLIAFLLFSDNIGGMGAATKNIDRTTFLSYVEKGYVKEADLEKETGRVAVYLTDAALNTEEFKKWIWKFIYEFVHYFILFRINLFPII